MEKQSLNPERNQQLIGSAAGAPAGASRAGNSRLKEKNMADWFSMFAELDPLSNPDNIGSNRDCL